MKSIQAMFLVLLSVLCLSACTDEKIIVQPSIDFIQTCDAEFIEDIFFKYTKTYFFNGDVFVTCEVADFLLSSSTSSSKFYSKNDLTDPARRLECSVFYEVTPTRAGEFVFDVQNNQSYVFLVNRAGPNENNPYLPGDCFIQSF